MRRKAIVLILLVLSLAIPLCSSIGEGTERVQLDGFTIEIPAESRLTPTQGGMIFNLHWEEKVPDRLLDYMDVRYLDRLLTEEEYEQGREDLPNALATILSGLPYKILETTEVSYEDNATCAGIAGCHTYEFSLDCLYHGKTPIQLRVKCILIETGGRTYWFTVYSDLDNRYESMLAMLETIQWDE